MQTHILRDQEDGLQELVAQHLRPVDVTPGHDICRQVSQSMECYVQIRAQMFQVTSVPWRQ
jgi:hypothetical protein